LVRNRQLQELSAHSNQQVVLLVHQQVEHLVHSQLLLMHSAGSNKQAVLSARSQQLIIPLVHSQLLMPSVDSNKQLVASAHSQQVVPLGHSLQPMHSAQLVALALQLLARVLSALSQLREVVDSSASLRQAEMHSANKLGITPLRHLVQNLLVVVCSVDSNQQLVASVHNQQLVASAFQRLALVPSVLSQLREVVDSSASLRQAEVYSANKLGITPLRHLVQNLLVVVCSAVSNQQLVASVHNQQQQLVVGFLALAGRFLLALRPRMRSARRQRERRRRLASRPRAPRLLSGPLRQLPEGSVTLEHLEARAARRSLGPRCKRSALPPLWLPHRRPAPWRPK
jgi:F0F1-type ATP synthase delta subunit